MKRRSFFAAIAAVLAPAKTAVVFHPATLTKRHLTVGALTVNTSHIANFCVSEAKVADAAVASVKLGDGSAIKFALNKTANTVGMRFEPPV